MTNYIKIRNLDKVPTDYNRTRCRSQEAAWPGTYYIKIYTCVGVLERLPDARFVKERGGRTVGSVMSKRRGKQTLICRKRWQQDERCRSITRQLNTRQIIPSLPPEWYCNMIGLADNLRKNLHEGEHQQKKGHVNIGSYRRHAARSPVNSRSKPCAAELQPKSSKILSNGLLHIILDVAFLSNIMPSTC